MLKLTALSLCLTLGSAIGLNLAGAIRNVQPSGHEVASYHAVELIKPAKLNAAASPEYGLDIHANPAHKRPVAWVVHVPTLVCGPFLPMLGRVGGRPNPFYGNVQKCEVM